MYGQNSLNETTAFLAMSAAADVAHDDAVTDGSFCGVVRWLDALDVDECPERVSVLQDLLACPAGLAGGQSSALGEQCLEPALQRAHVDAEGGARHRVVANSVPPCKHPLNLFEHRLADTLGFASALGDCCHIPLEMSPGCAGELPSSEADGLSVVHVDEPSGTLVAKFTKAGREITFDMRRGGPIETPPADSEVDTARMNIDARVLDQNGQPFYMQMAGDEFMDPTWNMPMLENIDDHEAGRPRDFGLIEAAEPSLRTVTLLPSLEQLRLGALQIARSMSKATEKPQMSEVHLSLAYQQGSAAWPCGRRRARHGSPLPREESTGQTIAVRMFRFRTFVQSVG